MGYYLKINKIVIIVIIIIIIIIIISIIIIIIIIYILLTGTNFFPSLNYIELGNFDIFTTTILSSFINPCLQLID